MAAVNRNMFDASITTEQPHGASLLVLPLNLIALIISHLDDTGDIARLCRTCRVLNYMTLPQLYKNITLTSYDKIRYRGDEPEGIGSASPFSMGLNAVITRPYASLVRSLTLRGDWRENELEEHARVGRVPDSSMMLNIAVRAAIERMTELETFRWELSTKMLETVYLGLAQLPKLTSLTVRFPSSRHPRPTLVIPPMPHLRSLKITHIDPLCYPDDISTLLWKGKRLRELKMHWSPRMRIEQEPSVMLHDYFRKCIAARQPLRLKKLALQNLYARHSEDFNAAIDPSTLEEITFLSESADNAKSLNTFFDSSWPTGPPTHDVNVKSVRQDSTTKRHAEFLGHFTGLEKLYFVSASRDATDYINSPRRLLPSSALTPPSLDHSRSTLSASTDNTPAASPSSNSSLQASIRDNYLNTIMLNHSATLRHLLLPSHWPLSASTIARLVHASPQLEQLAFATDVSSMDTLSLVLPFLRNLVALRLLVPAGTGPTPPASNDAPRTAKPVPGHSQKPFSVTSHIFNSARTLADIVEIDDQILVDKLSESLADQQVFRQLKILGMGRKAWQLGDYYTIPADSVAPNPEPQPATPTVASTASPTVNGQYDSNSATNGQNSTSQPQANPLTPSDPPSSSTRSPRKASQPPSLLGKRPRQNESPPVHPEKKWEPCLNDFGPCIPTQAVKDGRLWRRRVRRVGWEVLQHWEIWALDSQDI
ncbi:uncharacterized protein ACLA_016250 [Aspergillus clavatus NRRL 1]|uniref:F-box domain protein n=1 Tax=Aspergillus clavatus (strain ATCC 1007 / CBS 513.65 / DSM 816 / NCTC 3887 / NRRL 1 / QM 1276 / 107) TaxID=344612 RepID=A1CBR1_ASPCL|nr:uncharacterized protein ACLA_016250 [Aspergillus clavatus NRRL 1]EAW13179.1 conserved hypothetical protein [Aspergillus clavatus NRRL 1]